MNPRSILNFGSLNIDCVYQVPHFVRPGETLHALSFAKNAGGKGLNQSIALARAGARVRHAGAIGRDGAFLSDMLRENGVDISLLDIAGEPTGHAIIQTGPDGQNSIVLHGGANQSLSIDYIKRCLDTDPCIVLAQNETSHVPEILELAKERASPVVWNPAPVTDLPYQRLLPHVDCLILNEIEATEISGEDAPENAIRRLSEIAPQALIVLTLGEKGAILRNGGECTFRPALPVASIVDTTAAGDALTGYFVAAWAEGLTPVASLDMAMRAAALCVQKKGAAASIPIRSDL